MKKPNLKLEDLLLSSGKITKEQLDLALLRQINTGEKIDKILVDEGFVTINDIAELLERQLGIPYIDLERHFIRAEIVLKIPESIARRYDLIAIDIEGNSLLVAMSDPLNIFAIDDLKLYTNYEIKPVMADEASIRRNIDKYYRRELAERVLEEFIKFYEFKDMKMMNEEELLEVSSAPVVKFINTMIEQAIEMRDSDIHIEPWEDIVLIRFRIDGDLNEVMRLSISSHSALVTRIKIMGQMDIAEKRIPQDGRVEVKLKDREVDMRISTMPTVYGEKIVIRILDRSAFLLSKSQLGFNEKNIKLFNKIIGQPFGMILVTGPTGSGKTTTLYAILNELNKEARNIITIEDPVEYKLEGINQVQVNTKAGLTFAKGLRSILRQDPDIIMVGEIRDSETAKIAIRASITGHLVLSTLHTNDCPSSIIRLIDMGVEPYLVSSAIIGVISQRLVKKLCPHCKLPYKPSHSEKSLLGLEQEDSVILYKAIGCNRCNNGFMGRRAVHEVMVVNENMRELISKRASVDEIRAKAINSGMTTLLNNSIRLALEGVTTLEECLRAGFTID
ncbi:MAG: Flp pilus assembly complex ATPase component TadA [Tissierellia bacterium]|nr:Flp pilus assembly complex ATPase component TadA [Tissierellia bacterium]